MADNYVKKVVKKIGTSFVVVQLFNKLEVLR